MAVLIASCSSALFYRTDQPFVMGATIQNANHKAVVRNNGIGTAVPTQDGGVVMIASIIIWFLSYYPGKAATLRQWHEIEYQ